MSESETQAMKDEIERLRAAINLLRHIPIKSASSDKEPWAKINMIDLTMVLKVADGLTDSSDWVNEPCKHITGIGLDEGQYKFTHSPHHWSEYHEGIPAPVPLRTYHWCNGEMD